MLLVLNEILYIINTYVTFVLFCFLTTSGAKILVLSVSLDKNVSTELKREYKTTCMGCYAPAKRKIVELKKIKNKIYL